jgi:putative peptide zinc metalloprotease protein
VVSAAALAGIHFDVLRSRLPDFQTFFSARNVAWLAVALVLAKILHELGHALTNKHFGGECHEIGILLVLFTPCLYCNVSDAWLLANKWHRIAISAAGIVVELTLASTCTFLWWFSQPGLFNTLCLCVMCVCSTNTLLFNGNPLLRYDGYYILSDLLEIPNLGQQSQRLLARILSRLWLGLKLPRERWLSARQRVLLAFYAICSTGYRWLVVIAILWFGYRALKPYGLAVLAQTFALLAIAGLVLAPVWSLIMFFQNPVYQQRIRKLRAAAAAVVLAVLGGAIITLPLPARVSAPLVLHPRQPHYVYVSVPATLAKTTPAGTVVEKDQVLAQLVNLDVRKQIVELTGHRDQQRLQVQNLKLRLAADPSLAPQIPAAEELLADVESRLRQRQIDEQRLVLRSPLKGTVLPPPARLDKPYRPGVLDTWRGSPLDERNIHSYLETGTLFCLVGDPAALEAHLVIEQADMKFVRQGQRVRMQLDELPGGVLGGTIAEIAKTDLRVAPRELAAGNELPVAVDAEGVARPTETSYQVRVALDRSVPGLLLGDRGRAKILVEPQSLWQRGCRYLERTFNFKL